MRANDRSNGKRKDAGANPMESASVVTGGLLFVVLPWVEQRCGRTKLIGVEDDPNGENFDMDMGRSSIGVLAI